MGQTTANTKSNVGSNPSAAFTASGEQGKVLNKLDQVVQGGGKPKAKFLSKLTAVQQFGAPDVEVTE